MQTSRYSLLFQFADRSHAIVINALAGTMDAIARDADSVLAVLAGEADPRSLGQEELDYLRTRGHVVANAEEDTARLQQWLALEQAEEYPVDFVVLPTFACNLACTYCFQEERAVSDAMLDEKRLAAVFAAIRQITRELRPSTLPLMYLFGGEPLLPGAKALRVLHHTLQQAQEIGLRVGIVTNGVTLDRYAPVLRRGGVEFIQVTLDGPRAVHDRRRPFGNGRGSFADIVAGITALLDSGILLYIRINVDADNLESLLDLARFAHAQGWNRDQVVLFVGPYRDLLCRGYAHQLPEHLLLRYILNLHQHYPEARIIQLIGWPGVDFLHQYLLRRRMPPPRFSYCIASYGRFAFDAGGWVYACSTAAGDTRHAIGRYHPHLEIDAAKAGRWRQQRFLDHETCAQCGIAPLCGGGCQLQFRLIHEEKRPYCPETMENLKVAIEYNYAAILGG